MSELRTNPTAARVRSRIYALAENVLGVCAMTRPRAVFPGQIIVSTRRTTQRELLLRPDHETNNAFVYCMGEAAQRFDMKIVLSQMEGNHHHTMMIDCMVGRSSSASTSTR